MNIGKGIGLRGIAVKPVFNRAITLWALITLGMLFSIAVEAQDFNKASRRHFKAKYKTQLSIAGRECYLLGEKRDAPRKTPLFTTLATHKKKIKNQTLAEVDAPEPRNGIAMFARNR